MILAASGCEMSPDGDENVFGTNIHTICSVCNFEALFSSLTLEDMDFLVSLGFLLLLLISTMPNSGECRPLAGMGVRGRWGSRYPRNI